jgi:hypothetical protein
MIHADDVPIVGSGKNLLGVRVPPDPQADIRPDGGGNVHPGASGMSVAPRWRDLPYFLIPKRLKELVPDARGRNDLVCFRCGEGNFVESSITEKLTLKPDRPTHATVQPANTMPLADYQNAIAATCDGWTKDEA